jgi:hypothetical protein
VNFSITRILPALLLALIAAASGFWGYLSIRLGHMFENILRGFGMKVGHAIISWDVWFFFAVSLLAATAAGGLIVHKKWGRVIALLALGLCSTWAIAMIVLPEAQLENWFSTRLDRWAAGGTAAVTLLGFTWLSSRQAKAGFQRTGAIE